MNNDKTLYFLSQEKLVEVFYFLWYFLTKTEVIMELFEYLYRSKMKKKDLADIIGITKGSMSGLNQRKHSCSLLTAAKLIHISEGLMTLEDLMTEDDFQNYQKWLCKQKDFGVESIK